MSLEISIQLIFRQKCQDLLMTMRVFPTDCAASMDCPIQKREYHPYVIPYPKIT